MKTRFASAPLAVVAPVVMLLQGGICSQGSAQAPDFAWARQGGGTGFECGTVLVKNEDAIYMAGPFDGPTTFGDFVLEGGDGSYGYDQFVAKYTTTGELAWVQAVIGSCDTETYKLALDDLGNLYFSRIMDYSEIVVTKYAPDGGELCTIRAPAWDDDSYFDVVVNGAGNVYIAGSFYGTVQFGETNLTCHSDGRDLFLAKYDTRGHLRFVAQAGTTNTHGVTDSHGLAVDASGNAYVSGLMNGPATFGSITLTNGRCFLAKCDPLGAWQWAQIVATPPEFFPGRPIVDQGGNITFSASAVVQFDSKGNVRWTLPVMVNQNSTSVGLVQSGGQLHLWKIFSGSIAVGTNTVTGMGGENFLLGQCSLAGEVHWLQEGHCTGWLRVNKPSVDALSNVYVSGSFTDRLTFEDKTLTSTGPGDAFVASFDSTGRLRWFKHVGGPGEEMVYGFSADPAGNAYLTGSFDQSTIFGTNVLISCGSQDIFLASLPSGDRHPYLIRQPTSLNNGLLRLQLVGIESGATVIFERSTDLVTWKPILTNVAPNVVLEFTAPIAPDLGMGFYRASLR